MNLLLDTHALLWWLSDSEQLGPSAREAISHPDNLVYVSSVNVWEIIIKSALGRLSLPEEFPVVLANEPFRSLDMTIAHALRVGELPMHHRDPFDRLLIAQCLVDELALVTHDPLIARYDVPIVKA